MDFVRPIEAIVPGAQGRVLAVLAETTAELNLRTIAQLAGVSQAQASRLLPELVALGVIERREVPPSSLFRLVPEHVASRLLLTLSRSSETVLIEIGQLAASLPHPPVSVIVFGSFSRGTADAESDIDVVVVRPTDLDEDDETWTESLEGWRSAVRLLTGNPVEVLEVSADEATRKLNGRSQVWTDITREGRVVQGRSIEQLRTERILAAAGHSLAVTPRIRWGDIAFVRGGRIASVPDRLPDLPTSDALRSMEMPLHLDWSSSRRTVDLADRHQRARAYETVLREGRPADIELIVDGALLVDSWDDLVLPRQVRSAWQPLIDSARNSGA